MKEGADTRTHREFLLYAFSCATLIKDDPFVDYSHRTAAQTVLVSIALLCIMGVICSLTTKTLHRIVLWFAPVNSKLRICKYYLKSGELIGLLPSSPSNHWHLYCHPSLDTRKTIRPLGFHYCDRRIWMGVEVFFIPSRLLVGSMDNDRLRWDYSVCSCIRCQLRSRVTNTSW